MQPFETGLEAMFIEINIRKSKWFLFSSSYNSHKTDIKNHLKKPKKKTLIHCHLKYDYFTALTDFNAEPTETTISEFMEIYNFKN